MSKPWLLLRSGAAYDYGDTFCKDMDFEQDVVYPLAYICRFLGHCAQPWSVAAHAVLVSRIARFAGEPTKKVLGCLHHDDAEALVGDCPTPVKRQMGALFTELEDAAAYAIRWAAQLQGITHYEIPEVADYKRYDNVALLAERSVLKLPIPFGYAWGPATVPEDQPLIDWAALRVEAMLRMGVGYGEPAAQNYMEYMRLTSLEG